MAMQILGNVFELPVLVEKYIKDLETKVTELEAKVVAFVEKEKAVIVTDVKADVAEVETKATDVEKEIAADVQRTLSEAVADKDKFVAWIKKGVENLEADGGKVEHFFEHLFEKKSS
jgi:hypothetical protein